MLYKRKQAFLCILLLFILCMLFRTYAYAETKSDDELNLYIQSPEDTIPIQTVMDRTLSDNYVGYCGQYTHDVLAAVGIIKYEANAHNGKDWYPSYKNGSEGNLLEDNWTYECFDGADSLDKLLKKYDGTVYNIVVSKNSATAPEWGHVFFIHAIVNNEVYFSDSYNSKMGQAKTINKASLASFKEYYFSKPEQFNEKGIIHFYEKDYYTPVVYTSSDGSMSIKYINKELAIKSPKYNQMLLNAFDNIALDQIKACSSIANRIILYNYEYLSATVYGGNENSVPYRHAVYPANKPINNER